MHPLTTTTSFLLTLFFSLHSTTSSPSNDINNLSNCNQNFSCGALKNVTYPFTGGLRPSHCGPPEFGLTCDEDTVTILKANSLSYRVTHLNHTSQTFRLSRSDFHEDSLCTLEHTNSTLNNSIFVLDPSHETLSLFYTCDNINNSIFASDPTLRNFRFSCDIHGDPEEGLYVIYNPYFGYSYLSTIECNTSIQVPVLLSQAQQLLGNASLVGEVLKEGFDVRYIDPYSADCTRCHKKYPAGYCGFDAQLGKPICICNDQLCPGKQKSLVFMSLVNLTGEIDERRFLSNHRMLH
uniref:non-specific serine/threonine protein kinase n=1 Tax=Salix viminalis TaxID=40686 RepID=A0A6N2KWA1_SALVM